jgi:hypothetical protein
LAAALAESKCFFWLIVIFILAFLFVFRRHRFHQVLWVGGLSIAAGVVLRLFNLGAAGETELITEAYFLIGIGLVYGIVWLGTRYLTESQKTGPRKRD